MTDESRPTFDIAVVTSCHNYGRYLSDWARSIVALERRPAVVAIVDNGSTDGTPAAVAKAVEILKAGGLPDVRTKRIVRTDFGTARNTAVELGDGTEWVMHLDSDDVLLPHCLDDVAELAPVADVVPLGYERFGDLKAGPRNRRRVYSNSRGASTLRSSAPASGVSPFRRSFWERSPYRTDMTGGWDTALWIGFAHLNARFVAVKRPGFLYRQHADSVFNSRRINRRLGRVVGAKLNDLRKRREGVSILVPRLSDGGGPRDQSWAFVRERYAALYPTWEIVEGVVSEGPWRKGAAVADALEKSRGRTIVVADSDCVLPAPALQEAVNVVESRAAPWVVPHRLVKRLSAEATERILAERDFVPPYEEEFSRAPYEGFAGGGFFVVDASAYAATGGMPRSFSGWGAEDEATAVVLDTLLGPHTRLDYDLWHLWHPPAQRAGGTKTRENRIMFRMLSRVSGDPDAMFDLVERMNEGASFDDLVRYGANGDGGVSMVALVDFQRGTEIVRKGEVFLGTEEEAKRHEGRPRRIATRASSLSAAQLAALSPLRTVEIRSEQHLRNQEAAGKTGGVTIKGGG